MHYIDLNVTEYVEKLGSKIVGKHEALTDLKQAVANALLVFKVIPEKTPLSRLIL